MRTARRGFLLGLTAAFAVPRALRAQSSIVDASAFGAIADGKTDASIALNQAALAVPPGGTLRIPSGRYAMQSTLVVHSSMTIEGEGATLVFAQPWRFVVLPALGRDPGITPGHALLTNISHGADRLTDHDIKVRGIAFDYAGLRDGAAHAIQFRMARGILVESCSFAGGGDGTAFLACSTTEVSGCQSTGTLNCAYDHWEGTGDAVVRNCTAMCAGGYGILFTGAGTHAESRTAKGFTAVGNRIYHPADAGIWVNTLSAKSLVEDVKIVENTIDLQGAPGSGIGASGDAQNIRILNNTIIGTTVGNPIFLRPDKWGKPNGATIAGNTIKNCIVSDKNVSAIEALGSNVSISKNIISGGRMNIGIWTTASPSAVQGNKAIGADVRAFYRRAP